MASILCRSLAAAAMALAAWPLRAVSADESDGASLRAARDLFVSAERDEDGQRWGDALEKLRRVAQVRLTPGVRYHTALCEEHLGKLLTALEGYRAAAAQARTENAADVLRLVDGRVFDVADRIPHLVVVFAPPLPGASARLDGQPVAPGDAVAVDPGPHALDAQAPGRLPWSASVSVQEHENRSIEVRLETPLPPSPTPVSAARARGGRPDAFTMATGLAAVALAAGGAGAFVEGGAMHSNSVAQCNRTITPSSDACDPLKNAVRAWDWVALGAWAAAAATGTIAVVTWLRPRARERLETHVVAGPGSIGVAGSF